MDIICHHENVQIKTLRQSLQFPKMPNQQELFSSVGDGKLMTRILIYREIVTYSVKYIRSPLYLALVRSMQPWNGLLVAMR